MNIFNTKEGPSIAMETFNTLFENKNIKIEHIQSFEFKKSLMQKHFNQENFMHSKAFPKIKFKGKIKNLSKVNWKEDGKYPVIVEGDLTIRDVTKALSAEGTISIEKGSITATSIFVVKQISDYHVGKPKRKKMKNNVAEDIKITYKGIYKVK